MFADVEPPFCQMAYYVFLFYRFEWNISFARCSFFMHPWTKYWFLRNFHSGKRFLSTKCLTIKTLLNYCATVRYWNRFYYCGRSKPCVTLFTERNFDKWFLSFFLLILSVSLITANAEYIKMADHYVPVPGGTNNNNYANVDLILDIAKRMQVLYAGFLHLYTIQWLLYYNLFGSRAPLFTVNDSHLS